jgi:hypothetical protein
MEQVLSAAGVVRLDRMTMDLVMSPHHQELPIALRRKRPGQREHVAHADAPHGAAGLDGLEVGLRLLDAERDDLVAIVLDLVLAGVIVDFTLHLLVRVPGQLRVERGLGLGVVEVLQTIGARHHLLRDMPRGQALGITGLGRIEELDLLVARRRQALDRPIGHDQRMHAVVVHEVVRDPRPFHEAADEAEIGLAVLDQVRQRRIVLE